jgi:hypothetical protein
MLSSFPAFRAIVAVAVFSWVTGDHAASSAPLQAADVAAMRGRDFFVYYNLGSPRCFSRIKQTSGRVGSI